MFDEISPNQENCERGSKWSCDLPVVLNIYLFLDKIVFIINIWKAGFKLFYIKDNSVGNLINQIM
jgi:hypothetical protein